MYDSLKHKNLILRRKERPLKNKYIESKIVSRLHSYVHGKIDIKQVTSTGFIMKIVVAICVDTLNFENVCISNFNLWTGNGNSDIRTQTILTSLNSHSHFQLRIFIFIWYFLASNIQRKICLRSFAAAYGWGRGKRRPHLKSVTSSIIWDWL